MTPDEVNQLHAALDLAVERKVYVTVTFIPEYREDRADLLDRLGLDPREDLASSGCLSNDPEYPGPYTTVHFTSSPRPPKEANCA